MKKIHVFTGTDPCVGRCALVKSSVSRNILGSKAITFLMIDEDLEAHSPNTKVILKMNLKQSKL